MSEQTTAPAVDLTELAEAGRNAHAAASWHPQYDQLVVSEDGSLWLECTCGCGNSEQLSFPRPAHYRATLEWIAWAATNAAALLAVLTEAH